MNTSATSIDVDLFGEAIAVQSNIVNVSKVPHRSPFRYPGGKTWLVPTIRKWVHSFEKRRSLFVEPFAGGAIVGLSMAFENLVDEVCFVELDKGVAAVWETVLSDDAVWLSEKIRSFDLTVENAKKEIEKKNKTRRELAFCTLLRNRICHGGILAKGSGFIKRGENGKGISSRWYPATLQKRIQYIALIRNKIHFTSGDAFRVLETYKEDMDPLFFIDPPYTQAGRRLYTHFEIDHRALFRVASQLKGDVLLTYDDAEEIRRLADEFGFSYEAVPMKTTHHRKKYELLISKDMRWLS